MQNETFYIEIRVGSLLFSMTYVDPFKAFSTLHDHPQNNPLLIAVKPFYYCRNHQTAYYCVWVFLTQRKEMSSVYTAY